MRAGADPALGAPKPQLVAAAARRAAQGPRAARDRHADRRAPPRRDAPPRRARRGAHARLRARPPRPPRRRPAAPAAPAPLTTRSLPSHDRPDLRLHGHDGPPARRRRRARTSAASSWSTSTRPEPLPARQRAVPPERRPARGGPRSRRSCAPRSPPGLLAARAHRRPGRPDARRPRSRPPGYDRTRRAPELAARASARRAHRTRAPAKPDRNEPLARVTSPTHSIRRPPGVRLDTGGTGKGLAADLLARGSAHRPLGRRLRRRPARRRRVRRRGPRTRSPASTIHTLHVEDGAVATSGIDRRLWRAPDGTPRHHLLDPSTRRARLDRPDRRHRARADRARGRGARQGRAAERPAPAPRLAHTPRRPADPRRRRRPRSYEPAGPRPGGCSAAPPASSRSSSSPPRS